jgi:excinuclease ABC subunit B
MQEAAEALEFERAALLRDQIKALRSGAFRGPPGESKRPAGYARGRRRAGRGG